jgi:hypothetical protein
MRGKATWLIATAVGAILVAGVIDALRGSSSASEPAAARPTTTAATVQTTREEAAATTEPVAATEAAGTTSHVVRSVSPERLPSCATSQLALTFTTAGGSAELVLRRVEGTPCHHSRAPIGFAVRDQSGDRVAVFGGNTDTTQPADFSHGFEQLLQIPQLSCDPEGSFLVAGTVGPYVARRTFPGTKLPCDHG